MTIDLSQALAVAALVAVALRAAVRWARSRQALDRAVFLAVTPLAIASALSLWLGRSATAGSSPVHRLGMLLLLCLVFLQPGLFMGLSHRVTNRSSLPAKIVFLLGVVACIRIPFLGLARKTIDIPTLALIFFLLLVPYLYAGYELLTAAQRSHGLARRRLRWASGAAFVFPIVVVLGSTGSLLGQAGQALMQDGTQLALAAL
jgi:hypothetical protein